MKKTLKFLSGMATLLCITAPAQVAQPVIPPGKIAVFKAGTPDTNYPMITARCAPCFMQVFDPVTINQSSPLLSVAMSTNASVPGSVWINHHAGSEGGGLSRSTDRRYLVMEGYTGNIISPTASKPSTDQTVTRGIVTLDAFTNAISVYSDLANWFGIPAGSASGTQDNPTGIASTDGTNFWGTGNFSGTSSELDGTLFYNQYVGPAPYEVQNYLQAAGEARVIGGTLYVATKSATGVASGVYNFVDPSSGNVVPLPYDPNVPNPYQAPAFTNLYINWGTTFKTILNFDMDPANTVAYGADQTYGIIKFTNNAGVWTKAPYYFSSTNIGTTAQASGNQGCFGICVDFSGTNPVIYATTMENGYPVVNTAQGHQNQNRLIRIVDTGSSPGTTMVAQTLAVAATTNEFFGGIDFTPDLRPLITANPANYATTNGGSATFSVTAQCAFTATNQWLQNSNVLTGASGSTLTLNKLTTATNGFIYQCVVSDQYGSVTSAPAILTVTVNPVLPVITSGTNNVTGYVNGYITFPAVTATGTQPFTYQWYQGNQPLTDDGVNYSGSTSSSLTISNLTTADSTNYYMVVMNSAGYASNKVDVLAVKYHTAVINAGQPQSVTTFVGTPTSLTANETGATPPVTNQWYRGATALTDTGDFNGSGTPTLSISATATNDSGTNYYIVVSNAGGSVTSSLATVTVMLPPPLSFVAYSNQVYTQNFDSLPDPGGVSVNSINNPLDPGSINGLAYSLANPFDFTYPVINNSYLGGLGLSQMKGWYGAADTLYTGVDGITRFGAQDGDQSTGGVIDFGPNDVNGGIIGTNRALGLLSTSTTGSTTFALKLVNNSVNTLNYINLSFLGELWRNNTGARTMSFGYALDNTANTFVLTSESISSSTLVPGLAFSFPTAGVVTVVDGTQPSNQVSLAGNNLVLSGPWQPGAALWLIWSIDYYGSGGGQGYAIDNLSFSATTAPITVPQLTGTAFNQSGNNAGLTFSFTNTPYANAVFTIWSTTNLTLPFNQWQNLGHPTELPVGTYQFNDSHATNVPQRFYRVTSP
ncbi:MAG: immunoglobulin domain-containing protein [Limisphaerales bacterium]